MSDFFEDSPLCRRQREADPPLPRVVQLELTADCNLRCRFCPLQSEPRERRAEARRIEPDDLRTHLKTLLESAYEAELTGFGEIFCHPRLLDILRQLKSHRLTINATSNGTLWTAELLESLVGEELLDLICVSLDAGYPETYARLRVGGDMEKVLGNLLLLDKIKRWLGRDKPRLHLSFISMRENLNELPLVIGLAKRVGAEKVIVQGLYENESMAGQSTAGADEEQPVFATAAAVARANEVRLEFWYQSQAARPLAGAAEKVQITAPPAAGRPLVKQCGYPWERVFVKSDLTVQACATVWEKLIMGNLRESTIEEIWRGPRYRELRERLGGTATPAECRPCPTKPWRVPRYGFEISDHLEFGDPAPSQLGTGFYEPETDETSGSFRWSSGACSFFLRNTNRPFLELRLAAHPQAPDLPFVLRVNGVAIDLFTPRELIDLPTRFALPPFSEDILTIGIEPAAVYTPDQLGVGGSRRPLGLLYYSAALTGDPDLCRSRISTTDDQLARGFFPPETALGAGARWTGGRFSFVLPRAGNELRLGIQTVAATAGSALTVFDNGESCGRFTLPEKPGPHELRVPLAAPVLWHAVQVVCEKTWQPGERDRRRLGVLFRGASIRRRRWRR